VRIKENVLLLLILLVGLFLRLYSLSNYPVSMSWDEVAIGYNAFSIAEKGIDEYGNKYPILFRSFDDFKLPGYIYTTSVLIKAIGFSDFAVRLPSAIFGSFLILVIYFLFKELFNKKVGLIGAGIIAISPWAIQFSRGAFEANLGLFVAVLGITLLIYGLRNKFIAFISLPVLFSSIYFYYSQRKILSNIKNYIAGAIIGLVLVLPMIVQILSPQGFKRVNEVSILSDPALSLNYILARELNSDKFYDFIINRRTPYIFEVAHNYFEHFSPGFLFFGDDPNLRHRPGQHGLLYLIELPLLLIGLLALWGLKDKDKKLFIILWILIAPLTSALSKEAPHGLRSLLLLPPLIVLVSLGFSRIQDYKKLSIGLMIIYLGLFINYLISYYMVYPISSYAWAYGYEDLYKKVFSLEDKYEKIIITGDYWKPRIFYQYYKKGHPQKIENSSGFEKLGKYYFASTDWDKGLKLGSRDIGSIANENTLVIVSEKEFEFIKKDEKFKRIDEIKDYSGRQTVFILGEWITENTVRD
jgi:hypothetical protein